MQQSNHPARFNIPFANNAGPTYVRDIPQDHQSATTSDAPASLYDGFPPETFTPQSSGGVPPNGADVNGILRWLSQQARWNQSGGPALFDSTLATAIGGYPKGAVLASTVTAGVQFVSLVENNSTNPDVDPTNWRVQGSGSVTIAGTAWRRVASDGWIECGGVAGIPLSYEDSFSFTFPTPFPTNCLGFFATPINSAQSSSGQTTIQEVNLSAGGALLFAQNHQSYLADIAGGMRWRAWGY